MGVWSEIDTKLREGSILSDAENRAVLAELEEGGDSALWSFIENYGVEAMRRFRYYCKLMKEKEVKDGTI